MAVFSRRVELPVDAATAFAWHERPGAFARLTPPWERVRLIEAKGGIRDGGEARIGVKVLGPFGFQAIHRHREYSAGRLFVDVQSKGPFRHWRHEHRFESLGEGRCALEDHVEYGPPAFGASAVARRLDRMFAYRHEVLRQDLDDLAARGSPPPKTVLVTGAHGLVGSALAARLATRGHTVRALGRSGGDFVWDPMEDRLDPAALEGADAVVHLAGAPIAQRWTAARKQAIRESRVQGTRLLTEAILRMPESERPAFISASGAHYYGVCPEGEVDETANPGDGFLSEVCRAWEGAAQPLEDAGVRAVFLRTGVVLSPAGGALAKMLPAFRLGLGGPIGSGAQRMSWIGRHDLVEMYLRAIEEPAWSGPVNAVAPEPLSNRAFAETLGEVLGRPARLRVPAFAVRAGFGEMGRETLLADQTVAPRRAETLGFEWRRPQLEGALRFCLGRT